jgi:hypothetical protein
MAQSKDVAPYGTYGMMKSTIERFKDSTVPSKLNRHVLHDVSGGAFSALMSSLRFFGLIDENQGVKDEFRAVVEAARQGEIQYKDKMVQVVCDAYDPIVGAQFDLQSGTLPDLEKKFRDAGVPQGQMLTKAIRFYLKALDDAGIEVSEHITKPRRRVPGKNKTTKPQKKSKGGVAGTDSKDFESGETPHVTTVQDAIPKGFERLAVPGMKDAFIQYPSQLSKREYDLFKALLTVLGAYVSLDENGEDKKP